MDNPQEPELRKRSMPETADEPPTKQPRVLERENDDAVLPVPLRMPAAAQGLPASGGSAVSADADMQNERAAGTLRIVIRAIVPFSYATTDYG